MNSTDVKMFSDTIQYKKGNIWVKPVCDFFQINTRNQYQRIKNDPILGSLVGKNLPNMGEIDEKGRIFLTRKGFIRWIQTINANTISQDFREQFIIYQNVIFDFLYGSLEEHKIITKVNYELQQ